MTADREILTWDLFGSATRELAQEIADDFEPDMILSIARGGLLVGGALGYALGVKNTYTMNVEFYTGVDERLEVSTAVLYEKSHSMVACDYVWRRTDQWINFPGSDRPPVVRRADAVLDA